MFVIKNFLVALAGLVDLVFTIYIFVIIGRAVITWVNADPYNPVVRFLHQATDPLLYRIRRFIPVIGGIDFSPMVLLLAVIFLKSFIVPTLMHMAR